MPAWISHALSLLAEGWRDALPILLAALLHEAGHGLACRMLGVPLRFFRPIAGGAVIGYDASRISYTREAWIAAAGPLANLAGAILCFPGDCSRGRALFGISCLALALFNFLPIRNLDGGTFLAAVLQNHMDIRRCDRICSALSAACTVAVWIGAVSVQLRCGGNLSLLLISVYLLTRIGT